MKKNKNQKEINIFDNIPNIIDLLLPETLQERKDYLCLGFNKYSRIFVMTIYPEQTWVSWLDDLFNIGNINISVKIEPSSNGNVINQLTKKISSEPIRICNLFKTRKYTASSRIRKTNWRFRRAENVNTNKSRQIIFCNYFYNFKRRKFTRIKRKNKNIRK